MKYILFIIFLLSLQLSFGQKIRGKIEDKDHQPLIGATVLLLGTTDGAVTDVNGWFTLKVPELPATLVISYIGYITDTLEVTTLFGDGPSGNAFAHIESTTDKVTWADSDPVCATAMRASCSITIAAAEVSTGPSGSSKSQGGAP